MPINLIFASVHEYLVLLSFQKEAAHLSFLYVGQRHMINYDKWAVNGGDLSHFWAKPLTCLSTSLQLFFLVTLIMETQGESSLIPELSQGQQNLGNLPGPTADSI